MRAVALRLIGSIIGVLFVSQLDAAPYTGLVDFGDSLSDAGNSFALTGQPPSPPYFQGRASNGPVWVERLAPLLGVAVPTASTAGGPTATDFAFYGARTTGGSIPSVQQQVATYLAHATPTGSELFTLEGGADDFAAGALDPLAPANAIRDDIGTLIAAGGRNFVVLNLPPLGLTPLYRNTPLQQTATNLSNAYDAALAANLAALRAMHPEATIAEVDLDALFQQIIANPAAFGLSNVTDPALQGTSPTPVANPDQYLFWDEGHPTSTGQQLIAQAAATAVPEPAAVFGLVALAAWGTGRPRRHRQW